MPNERSDHLAVRSPTTIVARDRSRPVVGLNLRIDPPASATASKQKVRRGRRASINRSLTPPGRYYRRTERRFAIPDLRNSTAIRAFARTPAFIAVAYGEFECRQRAQNLENLDDFQKCSSCGRNRRNRRSRRQRCKCSKSAAARCATSRHGPECPGPAPGYAQYASELARSPSLRDKVAPPSSRSRLPLITFCCMPVGPTLGSAGMPPDLRNFDHQAAPDSPWTAITW